MKYSIKEIEKFLNMFNSKDKFSRKTIRNISNTQDNKWNNYFDNKKVISGERNS